MDVTAVRVDLIKHRISPLETVPVIGSLIDRQLVNKVVVAESNLLNIKVHQSKVR